MSTTTAPHCENCRTDDTARGLASQWRAKRPGQEWQHGRQMASLGFSVLYNTPPPCRGNEVELWENPALKAVALRWDR